MFCAGFPSSPNDQSAESRRLSISLAAQTLLVSPASLAKPFVDLKDSKVGWLSGAEIIDSVGRFSAAYRVTLCCEAAERHTASAWLNGSCTGRGPIYSPFPGTAGWPLGTDHPAVITAPTEEHHTAAQQFLLNLTSRIASRPLRHGQRPELNRYRRNRHKLQGRWRRRTVSPRQTNQLSDPC